MRVFIGLVMAAGLGAMGAIALFDVRGWMTGFRADEAAWWARGRFRRHLHPGAERFRTGDRIAGAFLLVLAVLLVAGVFYYPPG